MVCQKTRIMIVMKGLSGVPTCLINTRFDQIYYVPHDNNPQLKCWGWLLSHKAQDLGYAGGCTLNPTPTPTPSLVVATCVTALMLGGEPDVFWIRKHCESR